MFASRKAKTAFYTMVWYNVNNNTTYGMLWNYNLSVWEEQWAVTSQNTPCCWPGGWTMFESHNLSDNVCPVLENIRASGTEILRDDGTWVILSTSLSSGMAATGTCFDSGQYWFHFHSANWDWEMHD